MFYLNINLKMETIKDIENSRDGKKTELDIIKEIDTEIQEIKNDTNRWLTWLSELLIELAKMYWETRQNYRKGKTSYELNIITKKRDKEDELSKIEGKKITDSELTRFAERELTKGYQEYKDDEALSEMLEPILIAYKDYMNAVKFDSKSLVEVERFNNNKPF